ncbi:MAG: hypothetical protein WDW36_002623 [Sanguina aurantia]
MFQAAVEVAARPGSADAAVATKLAGFLQDACDFLREDNAQQSPEEQPAAAAGDSHFDDAGIIVDDETRWQRAQVSGTPLPVSSSSLPTATTASEQQGSGTDTEGGNASSLTAAVLTAAQRRAELQAELQRSIQDAMQAVAGSIDSMANGTQAVTDEMDAIIAMLGADTPYRPSKPPASKEAVAALPKLCITAAHLDAWGKGTACPVCTDELAEGEEVQVLPCKHVFHPPCLAPWLLQHNSCPMCRTELPTDDDGYERRKEREAQQAEERRGADNALPHNEFQYI